MTRTSDLAAVRRAHGFHPLRVKAVVPETADTRSFVLQVPDEVRDLFAYRAGQFCTFRVRVGGEELLRCYSMSSAPEVDADLTVTVKRVPGGRVSGWLVDEVAEGDVLEATRPAGVFCLHEHDRPVVAFAGGSGVTPVISIAKSALATTDRSVRLLYANRDAGSVIFRDQLAALGSEQPDRFAVRHHLDADGGYLDEERVAAFVGAERDADFYLCGPTPFMDLVERTLLDLGVGPDRIAVERFVPSGPVPAVVGTEAEASARVGEAGGGGGVDVGGAGGAAGAPAEVTIVLKGKRHTVAYHPGDTILETARRGGLSAPFSCEAGDCATCMALLTEGTATMRVNHALDDDEVEEGWVLTCQAIPQGPAVTVEYESY